MKKILFAVLMTPSIALAQTTGEGLQVLQTSPTIIAPTITGGLTATGPSAFTSLSASTTNPSLTFTATGTSAAPRFFASKLSDIVSVKDFGATGNGTADDTNAEIAAINAVCAAGGGEVYYPAGQYLTDQGSITNFCNGLYLVGAGPGATVITTNSTTGVMFPFQTLTGVGIENLTISYNNTSTAGSTVTLNNVPYFLMQNVRILGSYNPISVLGIGAPQIFNNIDLENTVTGGVGIYINGGNDQYLDNVLIYSPNTMPYVGIRIDASGGVWANNIDVVHNQFGLLVDPPVGNSVDWLSFSNAAFDSSGTHAIYFNPAGNVYGSNFSNVWASSSGDVGTYISSNGGTTSGLRFIGLRSFNNGREGLVITSTPASGASNIQISDSDFSGNSQSSPGTYNGITVGAGTSNFMITGCRSGVLGPFGNTQKYGIAVNSGSSNTYIITNNNATGNVAGDVSDNGTGSSKVVNNNL
jgi:hypothetical protein